MTYSLFLCRPQTEMLHFKLHLNLLYMYLCNIFSLASLLQSLKHLLSSPLKNVCHPLCQMNTEQWGKPEFLFIVFKVLPV